MFVLSISHPVLVMVLRTITQFKLFSFFPFYHVVQPCSTKKISASNCCQEVTIMFSSTNMWNVSVYKYPQCCMHKERICVHSLQLSASRSHEWALREEITVTGSNCLSVKPSYMCHSICTGPVYLLQLVRPKSCPLTFIWWSLIHFSSSAIHFTIGCRQSKRNRRFNLFSPCM